jgi:hypothetical protein
MKIEIEKTNQIDDMIYSYLLGVYLLGAGKNGGDEA